MSDTKRKLHVDSWEKRWIIASAILIVGFFLTVSIAGLSLGFQVPTLERTVNPNTVTDSGPFADPGLREISPGKYEAYIVARMFLFTPREITVPVGSEVTFYVTSIDVQHGFNLRDTNVNMQVVPGQISKLTATFDEPGVHDFICSEYCGIGHAAMFGTLTVEGE